MAGTSTPTAGQLYDLRLVLGVLSSAYTDGQLTSFWAQLVTAPNQLIQSRAVLALCYEGALAFLTNYHDMETGNTGEKLSQVFNNVKAMHELYRPALDRVMNTANQVAIGKVRAGKPQPVSPVDSNNDTDYNDWIDRFLE